MMTSNNSSASNNANLKPVAAHVLRHLARAQSRGRLVRLDQLAIDIGVRREDVRAVVSSLHAEGHVDAKRMKLTMSGFILAAAMRSAKLKDVRPAVQTAANSNERPAALQSYIRELRPMSEMEERESQYNVA